MINIAGRFRKILRTVFRGIGVSVISLILQACYGVMYPDEPAAYGMPPPDKETLIHGKVTASNTGDPIFGIKVSVDETDDRWEYTDKYGCFYFYSIPIKDEYKLKLTDVDGPYNGGYFKEKTITLKEEDTQTLILLVMDLDTEADGE